MQLLKDIVTLLSDKDGSLTDALLKMKVLLHRIGHKELADWVNDELNGYGDGKPVPAYRVVGARLLGNVQNSAWQFSKHGLPTTHLSDDVRKSLLEAPLRESVGVLEQFAAKPDTSLSIPIPPEFNSLLGKAIQNAWVTSAWTQIEATQILSVLIEIRSRLLDFVLNVQDQLGDVADDNMKEAAKGIDAAGMFASAVFGDNATVVIGNNNETTITNTVTKGDFAALAKAFKDTGVAEGDVDELKAAVDDDDPKAVAETKQFGPKVKAWMGKMSEKAISGAWSIGIAAGGKLLADALGGYYGIK
ncbi:histidine kinase [Burkholderia stabilis]|uniref:Histidine kinase n=2 Tax=Burkholderia stabilis TaxID=95485 RepID=A0A1Y1BFT3_9BURK|nr:histidine kinase [Burkholderia stabilis]